MVDRVAILRREHERLNAEADRLARAAREVAQLDAAGRRLAIEDVLVFLDEQVSPHTWLDERVLYPELRERLGDSLSAVSMNYDHLAIRRCIHDLAQADPDNVARLQELLYGLHALIVVHTWKEDELYLAALDSRSWPS